MSTAAPIAPSTGLPGLGGHVAILRAMGRKVGRIWWLVLPVLGLSALAMLSKRPGAVASAFCVSSAIALFLTWWSAASALMGLNDPISAHLMPGQLRRLRECAVSVFLAIAAGCGVLMGLVFDHTLVFTMIAAIGMLGFAACLRWPLLWVPLWVLPWLIMPPLRHQPFTLQLLDMLRAWHERQPLTQTSAILLACGAALWHLFQAGGATHAVSWRQAQRMRQVMSMQGGAKVACPTGPMAPLARFFQWGHPLWREHLLRAARPTAASVTARAEFAVLRGLHWSAAGSTTALVFTAFLVAELVLIVGWPEKAGRVIRSAMPGLSIGLMSAMLSPLFGLGSTLHQMRREQALLTLVPGLPRGDAMNRLLALRWMRHYVLMWAAGVGTILLMGALSPLPVSLAGGQDQPLLGLHFAAAALPAGLLAWRDWSRQGLPTGASVAMLTITLLIGMGLCVAASSLWGISVLWLLAGSVALTGTAMAWRWRALRRMPAFWPVGRHTVD